jgi:hypothetical protein
MASDTLHVGMNLDSQGSNLFMLYNIAVFYLACQIQDHLFAPLRLSRMAHLSFAL